ncbi:NADH-quinone oxidoreductase subunit G [Escherichia coli]|uniref:NADH-quinone oxidoreductase subunit G n=1 Tax=Escherichia coli TaxID=562 RepID=A0A376L920_ECOLX|nr:NADH-quinone oxidoreductase subunit G [Escherichia coli]
MARWKANFPVTWSKFARPAYSPTKRTPSVTTVNGICSLHRASASNVPSAVNISPGERYGELRRIENRYNGTVNHYFLCDRGRFGYGYVNLKDRPRQPVQRRGDDFITLNAEQAMQGAADILRQSKKSHRHRFSACQRGKQLCACVSWWAKENFYTGIAHGEQERLQLALKVLREGGIYTPALREIESYDAVLVAGRRRYPDRRARRAGSSSGGER